MRRWNPREQGGNSRGEESVLEQKKGEKELHITEELQRNAEVDRSERPGDGNLWRSEVRGGDRGEYLVLNRLFDRHNNRREKL